MPYVGALIGFFTVSMASAVMTYLQSQFKGDDCKRSRDYMLSLMGIALAGSVTMFTLEWLPYVPGEARAYFACFAALATIAIIAVGISYVAWKQKHQECYKAQIYNWIFAVVLALLWVLTLILTIFVP